MFDRICKERYFSEEKAANIFKQMISAVKYMHLNGICHRDLKPDNFLFENNQEGSIIKLIDFGLSSSFIDRETSKQIKMNTQCGTSYYMAPELIMGDYDERCDIWSLGVILYIMLCGMPPFYSADNEEEVYGMIIKGNVTFEDEVWQDISDEGKDLLLKILTSADMRLSLEQALNHPWFTKSHKPEGMNKINT